MPTLGDVIDTVREALARGDVYDGIIPSVIRQSARQLERDNNFYYMRKRADLVLLAGTRTLALPPRVKRITSLRMGENDYVYFRQAEGTLQPDPRFYEVIDGEIVLGAVLTEGADVPVELRYYAFSEWPTELSSTNWLLENADDYLWADACLTISGSDQEPELFQLWSAIRERSIATIQRAHEEFEYGNSVSEMRYAP